MTQVKFYRESHLQFLSAQMRQEMADRLRMREIEKIPEHDRTVGDIVEYSKLYQKHKTITSNA